MIKGMPSLIVLLLLTSLTARAGETAQVQPQWLTLQTLSQLNAIYAGERHLQIFWSLTCVPCYDELTTLGQVKNIEKLPIVLVSTDSKALAKKGQAFLQRHGLGKLPSWYLGDVIPMQMYQAIDADWYGGIPRTQAFDAKGKRYVHNGKSNVKKLVEWLQGRKADNG